MESQEVPCYVDGQLIGMATITPSAGFKYGDREPVCLDCTATVEMPMTVTTTWEWPATVWCDECEKHPATIETKRKGRKRNLCERCHKAMRVAMPIRSAPKIGRNQPCPCGSGKKFKTCCAKAIA